MKDANWSAQKNRGRGGIRKTGKSKDRSTREIHGEHARESMWDTRSKPYQRLLYSLFRPNHYLQQLITPHNPMVRGSVSFVFLYGLCNASPWHQFQLLPPRFSEFHHQEPYGLPRLKNTIYRSSYLTLPTLALMCTWCINAQTCM